MVSLENLNEEKIRLLREIAQLKTGKGMMSQEVGNGETHGTIKETAGSLFEPNHYLQAPGHPKTAGEVAMSSIGNLRVYEMMLGLCFITIILNWILMP